MRLFRQRRKKVLLGWELGAAFGHLGMILPLAQKVRNLGHDAIVVAPTAALRAHVAAAGLPTLAAPALPVVRPRSSPRTWQTQATILDDFGLADRHTCGRYLGAWADLVEQAAADVVIANAAPALQMVAKARRIPCAVAGIGIELPPRTSPFPDLRFWHETPPEERSEALKIERRLAATFDAVLGNGHAWAFAEWMTPTSDLLFTLPEIDPYGPRSAPYLGPYEFGATAEPPIPTADVVIYLRRAHTDPTPLMHELARKKLTTLLIVPDADEHVRTTASHLGMALSTEPISLSGILSNARLLITHGGPGLGCRALLEGLPHLVLPSQLEQFITGRRLASQRLAVMAKTKEPAAMVQALQFALGNRVLRDNLQRLADRYARADNIWTSHIDRALQEIVS